LYQVAICYLYLYFNYTYVWKFKKKLTINNGSFHVYFRTQPPKNKIGLDYKNLSHKEIFLNQSEIIISSFAFSMKSATVDMKSAPSTNQPQTAFSLAGTKLLKRFSPFSWTKSLPLM
jgi:hypothetical protein